MSSQPLPQNHSELSTLAGGILGALAAVLRLSTPPDLFIQHQAESAPESLVKIL